MVRLASGVDVRLFVCLHVYKYVCMYVWVSSSIHSFFFFRCASVSFFHIHSPSLCLSHDGYIGKGVVGGVNNEGWWDDGNGVVGAIPLMLQAVVVLLLSTDPDRFRPCIRRIGGMSVTPACCSNNLRFSRRRLLAGLTCSCCSSQASRVDVVGVVGTPDGEEEEDGEVTTTEGEVGENDEDPPPTHGE